MAGAVDSMREMVTYREPADMTLLVNKASAGLQELMQTINRCDENVPSEIFIDQTMVDEIISALKSIDAERLWLHESVEAETIKSSVLRHKLAAFPRDTEGEIRDAVKEARQSNITLIQEYRDNIKKSMDNKNELKKQLKDYKESNEILEVEHKSLREKYDDNLSTLNQTLLEKSSMQIKLNDTREKLCETLNSTKEYELALVELNEDMMTERQESAEAEAKLNVQIEETLVKLNQQKKLNAEKRIECEVFHQKQLSSNANLMRVLENVRQAEDKNSTLQNVFDEQSKTLKEKLSENFVLSQQRDASQEDLKHLHEQMLLEKAKLESDIKNVVSQLEVVRGEFEQLNKQKMISEDMLETAQKSEKQNEEDVEDTMKKLRLAKEELLVQSNECTRLKRTNAELQASITRAQQEHVASNEITSKECQLLEDSLEAEKKERLILQGKRDKIIKEASDYVTEFNVFVTKRTQSINEGKVVYQSKTEKGRKLQNLLKEVEIAMKEKQKGLQQAKSNYIQMQKEMKGRAKALQNSVAKLEEEIALKNENYDVQLPDFNALEEKCAQKTEDFQQMKKVVVEVKTKKADFEASVEEKQTRLNDMEGPKKKMLSELAESRQNYLNQLNAESKETRDVEKKIYESNQKLSAVELQNDRFKKAIEYFESDIAFMENRMQVIHDGKQNIDLTTEEYKDWLEMQWRKHMQLDKMYHDQDILLLDDIKRVEEMTSERETKILQIHGQLEEHLDALSKFIENVADMRPKDSDTT